MQVLNLLLHVIYKTIYYYSCLEMFMENKIEQLSNTRLIKRVTQNVSEYMHYRYPVMPPVQQYLFVENGNQILVYKSPDSLPLLPLLEPENYDFVIRNDYCKYNKNRRNVWINNKIIYRDMRDCGEYKVSTESFLSFVVFYGEQMIEIQLTTDTYNYMIVDNIIDKKFIYYLLKNMGVRVGDITEFDYSIQIITSNVDVLHLDSSQQLLIRDHDILI